MPGGNSKRGRRPAATNARRTAVGPGGDLSSASRASQSLTTSKDLERLWT
jgi:hypothetical protein